MQQTQQNCFLALALLVLGTALTPTLAVAASGPDPLLNPAQGPCDPQLDGPDYVAGTDADGNPVPAAGLPAAKVPLPEGILVPLGGNRGRRHRATAHTYAELNQKDVDAILNPKPACPPARKTR